jgi:hypothetical protein
MESGMSTMGDSQPEFFGERWAFAALLDRDPDQESALRLTERPGSIQLQIILDEVET